MTEESPTKTPLDTPMNPPFPQAQPYFAGDARTNRERMLAGDWYVSDDPDNARIAAHARMMLHRFERAFAEGEEDCWELLRSAIPGLGEGARLLPPVRVDYGENITVGEGTFANYGRRRGEPGSSRPTRSRSGTTSGSVVGSSCART